jgi:hypothetical protein
MEWTNPALAIGTFLTFCRYRSESVFDSFSLQSGWDVGGWKMRY